MTHLVTEAPKPLDRPRPHDRSRPDPMKRDWHAGEFRRLDALGESTTAGGWSTSPERCWVPVLGAFIDDFQSAPLQVINSGIGANVISRRSPGYEDSGKPQPTSGSTGTSSPTIPTC